MIHYEDYEREAQKDLVYVQEDMLAFYRSLNDPGKAQIEVFMIDKVDVDDLQILQEQAKINVCIPESLVRRIDRTIKGYHERKVNALPF
jgi:hypothetical protein